MGVAGPNRRGGRDGDGKGPARGQGRKPSAGRLGVRKTSDMDRHNAQNPSNARGKNANHSLAFTIPSNFTAGRDVQRQVMAAVARNGFNDDSTFAVRIAL